MKVIVTGGHPAPALAVIDELQKKKGIDIHFVGRQFAVEEGTAESYEYKQIKKLHIPFYHLQTGKLSRALSLKTIRNLLRTFTGLYQSYRYIKRINPDVIMSFGGYLALPMCIVGKALGVTVITHEQTISPGLANRIIGWVADKVLISFPETIKYFDVKKTIVTGNPMRKDALKIVHSPINIEKTKPVLYVTGGSLGSHSINVHIENILDDLLKKFIVIHQVGNVEEFNDFERLSSIKRKNYHVVEHFSSDEVGWAFNTADIVVSRGGANTTFELITLKKPCVIIPLPWSGNNEQEQHAKLFSVSGSGEIFYQNKESAELYKLIVKICENIDKYKKNFSLLKKYVHKHSAKEIVHEILS